MRYTARPVITSRLLILAAAVLWSTAGAAIKSSGLDGWQLAGGRSLVAGIFLLAVAKEARRRPTLRVLLVSVAYAFTVVLFVVATKLTTAANAIFIQDTAPLWVLLLSRSSCASSPPEESSSRCRSTRSVSGCSSSTSSRAGR